MNLNKIIFLLFLILLIINNIFSLDKNDLNKKLEEITNQKKFTYHLITENDDTKIKGQDWFDKILVFIKKVINSIKKIVNWIKSTSLILYYLIAVVFIVIIAVTLFFTIKKLSFKRKEKNNKLLNVFSKRGHFNYEIEYNNAVREMKKGNLKLAVPLFLNALWLFYHSRKSIVYKQSKTNREYLEVLKNDIEYTNLNKLVLSAEYAVYFKEKIDEDDCEKIFNTVKKIIFK